MTQTPNRASRATLLLCAMVAACSSSSGSGGNNTTGPTNTPVLTTINVSLQPSSITVGQTSTATATGADQFGAAIATGGIAWSSSATNVATVSQAGVVTGVTAGTAAIIATNGTKTGTNTITVTAPASTNCTPANALQLTLGQTRTLSASEIASLCVGGGAAATEYVLIPFNNNTVAATSTSLTVSSTATLGTTVSPLAADRIPVAPKFQVSPLVRARRSPANLAAERARRDFEAETFRSIVPASRRQMRFDPASAKYTLAPSGGGSRITGLGASPAVGATVSLNVGNTNACSGAPITHTATVRAISTNAIIAEDNGAPSGGLTTADYQTFGSNFDSQVFGLDVANFGAPTDIDGNGKILILFTQAVNALTPAGSNSIIGGFFYNRDLLAVAQCPGSNGGEMFYMPVLDPNNTFNSFYNNKTELMTSGIATLAHEFQHLINFGRRAYVNNAPVSETVAMNEGLSHIAEELLYYQQSGKAPLQNINVNDIRATQAQLDAFNNIQIDNFGRLDEYMRATETTGPTGTDGGDLAMRGAIWQLLRYGADRKGGSQTATWQALVNSTTSGTANFSNVLGDFVTFARDWAVAQFTDDAGLGVASNLTMPSWNFRSIWPPLENDGKNPLATRQLIGGVPQTFNLKGVGAAYIRFRVSASAPGTVTITSAGGVAPSNIDVILVRTQ